MKNIFLDWYTTSKKNLMKVIGVPHGKANFFRKIDLKGELLDVGCGNNSPYFIKTNWPDIHYTGIDIGDYNQQKPNLADEYIISSPENFANTIANMKSKYDAVISAHNLEHCNDREATLEAMIKVLKTGGYLYLAFPTEESVNFPSRKGTLNYYDDPTHKDTPPNYDEVLALLKANAMDIIFASKSYKPFFYFLAGALLEWKSSKKKEVKYWNWLYWGFETIIWARKTT